MAKVRDFDSERAAHPAVAGAFSVPYTQDSIAYGGVQDYDIENPLQSVASSVAGDQITFDAKRSLGLTDVENSFLVVKCHWDLAAVIDDKTAGLSYPTIGDAYNDTNAPAWVSGFTYPLLPSAGVSGVCPPPMFAATLFDDVVLSINGREVVTTLGKAQPYGYFASVVKNRNNGDKEAGRFSEGFIMDGGTARDTWQSRYDRMDYFMYGNGGSGESFTLVYRLTNLGFNVTHGSMLPPNVHIRLRLRRTPDNFVRMGPTAALAAVNPTLKLGECQLMLARRMMDPLAKGAYDVAWLERPIKIAFEKVKVEQFPQPAGTTNINIVNSLAGPTPTAVYVMLLKTSTINGTNNEDSAFDLAFTGGPYWSNASLSLGGGRTYPIQPLQTFDGKAGYNRADIAQMYQQYRETCNNAGDPFLSSADFMSTPLLAFQIGTRTDAWDAAEEVSCSFQGTLNVAPWGGATAFTILMCSFTDGLVQIAYSGETAVTSV